MGTTLHIGIDINPALLLLKARRGEKRFAFAVVNALNNAAKTLQKRIQEDAKDELNIRKPFALRQVAIIKPFASVGKSRPYAEISVGQKDRLLLPELASVEHEQRQPFTPGAKRVAVPFLNGAPRSHSKGDVPKAFYFKNLRLKRGKKARAKKMDGQGGDPEVWYGQQRTYMIPAVGVFQRTGSGDRESKLIYAFDKDVPIPNRLNFISISERFGAIDLQEALQQEIIKEIARGL